MSQGLKQSEKSMIQSVDAQLRRIMRKDRAGSIFNPAEEIAIEWVLKDLLEQDTSDIERRIVDARKRFCASFCEKSTNQEKTNP